MLENKKSHAPEFLNPQGLFDPQPYGFSHIAKISADSRLIFIAGQGGEENKKGELSSDFRRQTSQALWNIQEALRSQDLDMRSVVKVTTLIADYNEDKLHVLIEEFKRVWPDKKYPVNTLIPVPRLALANMLIEIDAVAVSNN